MEVRQIVVNVPEKVLLAEKTDEASFARELLMLAAVKPEAIANTSSLVYLHRIGVLDWLPKLFSEIWIPIEDACGGLI